MYFLTKCLAFFSLASLLHKQRDFKPWDSYINQLVWFTEKIYKSFDDGLEIRIVFKDIFKAFHNAWHERFIFKLKQKGISDELLHIATGF